MSYSHRLTQLIGFLALFCASIVAVSVSASPADAHLEIPNSKQWYFNGATWKEDRSEAVDPVNVIFYKGGAPITESSLVAMLSNSNWSEMNAGNGCGSSQRMIWRDRFKNTTSDKQDLSYADEGCGHPGGRFHMRLWDDQEHRGITQDEQPKHGDEGQWLVGGVHHEHRVTCVCGDIGKHQTDRDWDDVRREVVRRLHSQCSDPTWRKVPGASGRFGSYSSSGWVARISRQKTSDGCAGA